MDLTNIMPLVSEAARDTAEADGIRNKGLDIVLFKDIKITNFKNYKYIEKSRNE